MSWNFSDGIPIYLQIMDLIKLSIISGVYNAGERLPSVREMAAQAGVNPNTVQRALQELEREGLVFSQRTSGRFITEDTRMINLLKDKIAEGYIRDFLNKMNSLGFDKNTAENMLKNYSEEMK